MYLEPLRAQNIAYRNSMRASVSSAWEILREFLDALPAVVPVTDQLLQAVIDANLHHAAGDDVAEPQVVSP